MSNTNSNLPTGFELHGALLLELEETTPASLETIEREARAYEAHQRALLAELRSLRLLFAWTCKEFGDDEAMPLTARIDEIERDFPFLEDALLGPACEPPFPGAE